MVRVEVVRQDLSPQLVLDTASMVLDTFGIVDDDWETNTPLSVTLQILSDKVTTTAKELAASNDSFSDVNSESSGLPVRLSLASTRGLLFSEVGGRGDGSSDVITSFQASETASSEAIRRITIAVDEPVVNTNFALKIDVEDNVQDASLSASLSVPVSLTFSSVPQISSVEPSTVFSTGGSVIDVRGMFFSKDIQLCSVGGIVSPAVRLNVNAMRCNVPSLPTGQHKVYLMTEAGIASNAHTFSAVDEPEALSITPHPLFLLADRL